MKSVNSCELNQFYFHTQTSQIKAKNRDFHKFTSPTNTIKILKK